MSDDYQSYDRPNSIRSLLGGFSALLCNRAELIGVELQEQKFELLFCLQ